ncbi:respiratory nitrate reductase subunit gamma [Lacicoccus alkaliphilus]|jgi:nitrate reductase gamma subunit|uniref:Nitrate reductase gamma subunit n=1 Tax=Lacicoccus alkaliphilus DSM 16010 TaxID=1123231 RepID=A0A1M7F3J6_9BACL|nr:respiratory nitrate reductase subunit gamma [Salinicoccus alkaliphilus]SHL98565.1 nitrate reductase gamma subunit [Salinicoccus alkaliphilus DSM 16010]
MLDQFLWVIFPYLCVAIFIVGHIWRYRIDQFGWTAKSSEFIEKKQLMVGSILFHFAVIPVFLGHIVGLFIPAHWMSAIGVNEHIYHLGAVYVGGFFGIVMFVGMFLLTFRRINNKSVRKLSSASDMVVNFLLLFITFIGIYATLVTNNIVTDFDYRQSISVWTRGLVTFSPDASLMTDVPLTFQIHVLSAFLIFALWPATRLVHAWSLPFNYVGRSYIVYRKHKK